MTVRRYERKRVGVKWHEGAGCFVPYDLGTGEWIPTYKDFHYGENDDSVNGIGDDADVSAKTLKRDGTADKEADLIGYASVVTEEK